MSSENNKTATTKETLKPFFIPSHLTFSFLLDSDFWILKVFKNVFLCIVHSARWKPCISSFLAFEVWHFFRLPYSGTSILFCFGNIHLKSTFLNSSLSWFLPTSLGLSTCHFAPSQMPEAMWVTLLAPSLIDGQKLSLQDHFSICCTPVAQEEMNIQPWGAFSPRPRGTEEPKITDSDFWVGCLSQGQ